MLVASLSLLCLYSAVGMLVSALLAHPPTGPAFWRLSLLLMIAGGGLGVGLRVAGLTDAVPPFGPLPLAALAASLVVLIAFGVRVTTADEAPRALLALATLAAVVGIGLDPAIRPANAVGLGAVVYVAGLATVGTALGSVLQAMILAHWYLIEPRLPIAPLQRVLALFMATEIGKAILLIALVAIHLPGWTAAPGGLMRSFVLGDALFVAVRAFLGVLAPIGLGWMTWKTVEIRSIQSATGILYAAIVFVLFGEVISLYLSLSTGLPY